MAALENWDDDLEIHGDIFNNSISTVKTSISSRLSVRSESNAGDNDWEVSLSLNDPQSTFNALSSAKQAGIPIPLSVPASALVGGSITRLGKKKAPTNIDNDWGNELDFPSTINSDLKVKPLEKRSEEVTEEEEDDFDEDWAEGSLGIRFGGTRRTSKNRNSSVSAMSPSMGSCITVESEDDALDGLIIPLGPMDFETALKKRQDLQMEESQNVIMEDWALPKTPLEASNLHKEDFLADIDIGNGDVYDPKKRTLNRNIKLNWKAAKDATPASRPQATVTFTDKAASTKIPRPSTSSKPSRLEPVFETGATNIIKPRRWEPTTTGAQLLRSKRSMPLLRNQGVLLTKSPPVPSLPIVHATGLPHQARIKTQSHLRRDSDPSRPQSPPARPHSRLSTAITPDTPTRLRRDVAPPALLKEAATKRFVTRPVRRQNFGNGTELECLDDLPTSTTKESKFIKQPSSRAPPKNLRAQPSQSRLGLRDKMMTPMPPNTPKSPPRTENLPRFARDTAASRIAREQKLGPTVPNKLQKSEAPLVPRINWPATFGARTPHTSPTAQRTRKMPTLINGMGKENYRQFEHEAGKKGMHWNVNLCRWEGNENALLSFDHVVPPSPPRPALITNMAGTQGVQVNGGMVFDPHRMCWLKAPGDPSTASMGDDDDPFGEIEDLPETKQTVTNNASGTRGAVVGNEWLVGEEFDLGPDFIKRQREEETVWRHRVGAWFGEGREPDADAYKWAIRDIAATVLL